MFRVYLALGSNMAKPLQQIRSALQAIKHLPNTTLIACSSFYRSKPLGPQNQPDFLNAAVELDTLLAPEELLKQTQLIEMHHGRKPSTQRWGPRTLDVDIMLYNDQIIETDLLKVPHYGLKHREFMLYPLAEIAPNIILPDGESLANCLKQIQQNSLVLWNKQNAALSSKNSR